MISDSLQRACLVLWDWDRHTRALAPAQIRDANEQVHFVSKYLRIVFAQSTRRPLGGLTDSSVRCRVLSRNREGRPCVAERMPATAARGSSRSYGWQAQTAEFVYRDTTNQSRLVACWRPVVLLHQGRPEGHYLKSRLQTARLCLLPRLAFAGSTFQ